MLPALLAGLLLALAILLLFRGGRAAAPAPGGSSGGRRASGAAERGAQRPPRPGEPGGGLRPGACPLCGSLLGPGERVKSELGPGGGDRLMRIYGCPKCWPPLPGRPIRLCPVCGEAIPAEGPAFARYFERPGRKHVHVLGCGSCRGPQRER